MHTFARSSAVFRTTVAGAVYACTAVAVLSGAAGLVLWMKFLVLGLLFLCLGAVVFPMDTFARIAAVFRTAVAGTVYACTAVAVLSGGFVLWTTFHLSLRRLGHPTVMLGLLFLCLGAVVFPMAALLAQRLITNRASRTMLHLRTAGPLYWYAMMATLSIIAVPRPDGLEGGDVALRASILIAVYAIVINAVLAWWADAEKHT